MRKEETARTRSLLNNAKLMEENSMLFKLKEMEYVEKIADKISNISVSGNGVLIEQVKQILVPKKQKNKDAAVALPCAAAFRWGRILFLVLVML